jgi:hypothetical protein
MQMELKNPKTGEIKLVEIDEALAHQLQDGLKPGTTKSKLHDMIDNFKIPAEAKALLFSLADLTIKIGSTAIYVGQKMIELVVYFAKQYPKTTLGLIVGTVISLIITSIPIVGFFAGWVVTPLCLSLGLAVGFLGDLNNQQLEGAVKGAASKVFGALSTVAV